MQPIYVEDEATLGFIEGMTQVEMKCSINEARSFLSMVKRNNAYAGAGPAFLGIRVGLMMKDTE